MQSDSIVLAVSCLTGFIAQAITKSLETIRIAKSVKSLLDAGILRSGPPLRVATDCLVTKQQSDGGWSDPEETAWACTVLREVNAHNDPSVRSAIQWLDSVRKPSGGWGRHDRDQARIPTTALIAALVPDVVTSSDITWLTNEWQHDFAGPVRLSYKAGFFLLAVPERRADDLVAETIAHLALDQNDDGGFAPWRNHPIGSDPWSTGIVLWGLSRWVTKVDKTVIEKALAWLERSQLPSGYWTYHYLDDGTSLALIGTVTVMKALAASE